MKGSAYKSMNSVWVFIDCNLHVPQLYFTSSLRRPEFVCMSNSHPSFTRDKHIVVVEPWYGSPFSVLVAVNSDPNVVNVENTSIDD